jgi:NagD protein
MRATDSWLRTAIIGAAADCRTVLVLSGGTKSSDLANFAYQPDMIVESLGHVQPEDLVVTCMA